MEAYEVSFSSELYRIRGVVQEIMNYLLHNVPNLTEEDRFDIRLIFSELLCNAVVHGNREDVAKRVNVVVEIAKDVIFARITDEGPGFDYIQLLTGLNDGDRGGESGRGMRLVYSLTDSVAFNQYGNQITFYKRVKIRHG
ncbi:MAG: ATP-binding protein [Firmicutes bacterium]|nr:ATP-binding protein [Bacillota bacterium]